jgi:hypothetical protein
MIENTTDETQARILALMYVLYEHGIQEVHMGGLMRILGVDNDTAAEFDHKVFVLDDDFAKYINNIQLSRDPAQLLH